MSTLQTYENFSDDVIDPQKWFILEIPVGDGNSRRYEEPNAKVSIKNGVLEVDIPRFETYHDQAQMMSVMLLLHLTSLTSPLERYSTP